MSMRKLLGLAVAVLVLVGLVGGPASATSRTVYRSDILTLRASLTHHRLRLTHTSLSDYVVVGRCKTLLGGNRYRTSFALNPHEVWTTRFRVPDKSLLGVKASCRASAQTTYQGAAIQIAWNDGLIEVLTASWIQPSGDWQTDMFFYNVTASSVSFTCSWTYHGQTGGTSPGTWTETLAAYHNDSLGGGGTQSISDLTCTETA
jgi:hypothetical protein